MGKCCHLVAAAEPSREAVTAVHVSLRGQALSLMGWILPATALALMPKCPVCVAAYAAAFTGIGVSLTVASYLRASLIAVAVVALVSMAAVRVAAAGKKVSAD